LSLADNKVKATSARKDSHADANSDAPTPAPTPQCSAPNISSSGGYPNAMTVTMTPQTPGGSTIFYTMTNPTTGYVMPTHNGSTPTGSTQVYIGPISVSANSEKYFEAIEYKAGMTDSVPEQFDADNRGGMSPMTASSSFTSITYSVWDGDWALLEEYDKNGNVIQKYLQGYHGLVKTFVGTAIYYYQDELGSTSHVANASGQLLEHYKYNLGQRQVVTETANGGHRTAAEMAATREHEDKHVPSAKALHDQYQKKIDTVIGQYSENGSEKNRKAAAQKEADQLRRELDQRFHSHEPRSEWEDVLKREGRTSGQINQMYRNGNASVGTGTVYVCGSSLSGFGSSGSIAYGERPDGSFVDSPGSNVNLGGDSSPSFSSLVAPEK
jgi:hypothetical protein